MDGELFGRNTVNSETIDLKNEIVTAIEFYNFPSTDSWHGTICAISISTTSETEKQKQVLLHGPYDKFNCRANATERVYGAIPSKMSFKEFLRTFSSRLDYLVDGDTDFITISLPPWTATTTTQTTTTETLGKFYHEMKRHL